MKGFAVLPVVIGLVVLALAVGVLSRQGTALSDTARGLQDESRLSGLLDAAYLAAEKELDARSCGGYTAVTSSLDGNTFGAQFSSVEGSPVALTLSASLVSGGSRTRLVPAETAYDAPKTLQMPITKGAFIKKDKPAENKGSDPNVKTGESVSKENRGLLQVDLSGLPAGVRIDSATLQYKINGKGDNGLVINIHRLLEDWDEDVVSWDVRDQGTILGFPYDIDWGDAGGTHDTEVFASFPGDVSGPGQTVDITSLVRLWVSGDVPNHGMLLRWAASMGAKTADMASDDDAVNAPSVVVTYSCACGSACSVDNYISCDGNLRGNTQVGSFSPSLPTLQGLASVPANQSVAGITFADEGGVIVASGPDLNAYDATGALTGSCTLPNALTGLDYISAGPDVGKLVATTTQPSPLLVIVGATCGVERSQPVTGSALSSPVGVTYLRLPAGHAWEDHFAMVDASGNIEVVDPTGTPVALVTPDFAPAVAGDVAQVYNQERFLLLDAGRNEVMHVLFDGAVEERYDINRFGVGTAGALAVDMASCAHLVGSSATNKVVRLIETPLSQSPQAHWRLDEQSGAAAVDRVGGNDATLSGTPTWQPVGGAVQGALELDAADEGAQVADPGRLNLTGSVSLSGWLYTNTVSGRQPVVSRTLAAGSHQYWLGLDNGAVALQFNDGSARTLTGSATVMPGEWHHLAAVIDTAAGVATVYLDGVADGTTAAGLSLSSGPVPVQLGHDGTDSTIGRIDDVRIFQGALLPADVALLAAEGVSGGGAMGAGMPCDTQNYRDEFATVTFAGTGGSLPWPDAWTEIGENDGVSSGEIRVLTSPRAIRVQRNSRGIQRRVDLSQFTSATLTFEYARYGMDVGDYITVDVGDGTTWTELGRIEGPGDDSTSSMLSMSYDLGAYLQADRYIRFKAYPSMGSSEGAYIDNVDITGCSL
ncbi:MAG: DNRLRE domain-containing protein [Pseudomonadales bacterium]|nr:DNRLRE domain-containing protein [Pseudomonadales bacterium]